MHIYIKMLRTVQHLTLHQKQGEQRHSSKAPVVRQQKLKPQQPRASSNVECLAFNKHHAKYFTSLDHSMSRDDSWNPGAQVLR